MTLRVLYVAHNARDEQKGAAYADISLLSGLRRRGHDVEERWDIGAPRRIRHDNLHLLLEAPGRCESAVERELLVAPYDVVLCNQPLGFKAASMVRRRFPATLYVARSHGWEPFAADASRSAGGDGSRRSRVRMLASRALEPFLWRQNRLLLRWSRGLVVGSRADGARIVESGAISANRVVAVEPGIPTEFLERPLGEMTGERAQRLLYVGQFDRFKAPEVAARAIGAVLERNPNASATWVCSAEHHESVRGLFPFRLQQRLTTLPWLRRQELMVVYDRHGIFVFPSRFEGFGQTFLEAMARGLVVLASRVGGMAQVIRSGENGFLFDAGDADGMAERALAIQRDATLLATVRARARGTASGYTWEVAAQRLEEFLEQLRRLEGLSQAR